MSSHSLLSGHLADEINCRAIKTYIVCQALNSFGLPRANLDEIADEIYQQLCVIALSKARDGGFDCSRKEPPIAWLMCIATNLLKSRRRDDARSRSRTVHFTPTDWEEASTVEIESDGDYDEILAAMTRLTPRLREAFELRYFEELKGSVLAERLGVSSNSAAVMTSLAKKQVIDLVRGGRRKEVSR